MKSLFFRLLVSMWLTMGVLVAVLALIHASIVPKEVSPQKRQFQMRSAELRGEEYLRCTVENQKEDCTTILKPINERDDRIVLYRNGKLVAGCDPVTDFEDLDRRARAAPDQMATRSSDEDVLAMVLPSDPSVTTIAAGPPRSRWVVFIMQETLPYRLVAIFVVTGLIALLLARYLSRPLRVLRGAAQRMAEGDLTVRVSPKLRTADNETYALAKDMDGMAERIHDLLDAQRRLLRDVSHELRSPLARLAISLELVRRRSPEDVAPALDRIERETDRLNEMIGELLTLSRLESGQGLENAEPVDLKALVETVAEDAALEAEPNGTRVATKLAEDCVAAGNSELLRRAVENVVRNAVRFGAPGSTVEVALAREGELASIRVRDHGPGVPDEALDRLFEPFYRVEADRARTKGGTGIGLAITKRAVSLHGGSVAAHNAEGGGLEVIMRIPAGHRLLNA